MNQVHGTMERNVSIEADRYAADLAWQASAEIRRKH